MDKERKARTEAMRQAAAEYRAARARAARGEVTLPPASILDLDDTTISAALVERSAPTPWRGHGQQ